VDVFFFVLFAMMTLAPGRDHAANATAITSVLLDERPLFKNDGDRMRTAALVVAMAFRESSLRNDVSSATNDYCLMQINKRPDLANDPAMCVRVAMVMIRESMRMCPEYPIAFYASGPIGCTNVRAQRISRDRLALAQRLLGSAPR
jgi:hypothetical protein